LYSSPNIIRDMGTAYKILGRKPQRKTLLGRPNCSKGKGKGKIVPVLN